VPDGSDEGGGGGTCGLDTVHSGTPTLSRPSMNATPMPFPNSEYDLLCSVQSGEPGRLDSKTVVSVYCWNGTASDQARAEAIECHAFGRTFAHIPVSQTCEVGSLTAKKRRADAPIVFCAPAYHRNYGDRAPTSRDYPTRRCASVCTSVHPVIRISGIHSNVLRLPIQ
jgi:hypothetical protein